MSNTFRTDEYPIPDWAQASIENLPEIRMLDYAVLRRRGAAAKLPAALADGKRNGKTVCMFSIDKQNTFIRSDGQLHVENSPDDEKRWVGWSYKHIGLPTREVLTLDTHYWFQPSNATFWVDKHGRPLKENTPVSHAAVVAGEIVPDPAMSFNWVNVEGDALWTRQFAEQYTADLETNGRFGLMAWMPHALLGGVEHANVTAVHELVQYHAAVRSANPHYLVKGNRAAERYSALGEDVLEAFDGQVIGTFSRDFLEALLTYAYVIVSGQAASHCVAWTLRDILTFILKYDPTLASKIYILEDTTSPVIVRDEHGNIVADFTSVARDAMNDFAASGMNLVTTDMKLKDWKGFKIY